MSAKRIIIFSEDFPPHPGGIAQWASGVAEQLSKRGHSVKVVTRHRNDTRQSSGDGRKYVLHYMRGARWKQLRTWYCHREIKKIIKAEGAPDIIIATTWNFARGISGLCKRFSVVLITVTHGLEVTRRMSIFKKRWLKKTLEASARVIAVSRFTRDKLLELHSLSADKLCVIPNGVDDTVFHPQSETIELRKQLGVGEHMVLLTLARVVERKGHDNVIRALPAVLRSVPNVRYVIAGPWEETYYRRLRELVGELGLEDRVVFAGYVRSEQIAQFYNMCDVYIMPSRELASTGDSEGFGITYLEANACEKPVIGGKSGGVLDAVVDGETGLLVDPENIAEIADKIVLLLTHRKLARKIGISGRKRIETQYNWRAITARIEAECFADS